MTESGDLSEKWWVVRQVVGRYVFSVLLNIDKQIESHILTINWRYLPLPPLPPNLQNITAKAAYGRWPILKIFLKILIPSRVKVTFVSTLFDSLGALAATTYQSLQPLSFETINQSSGLVVYSTQLGSRLLPDPSLLKVSGSCDIFLPLLSPIPYVTPISTRCQDLRTGAMSSWTTGEHLADTVSCIWISVFKSSFQARGYPQPRAGVV